MLAAVVGLIAASACLVGVCILLVSVTQARAFDAEVERTQPEDVDVTAFLVDLPGSELQDARSLATRIVTDDLAGMRPTVTTDAVGPMRDLGDDRLAYLATDDDLAARAALVSGRWPGDPSGARPEAVLPATAARLLGLHVGDTLALGDEVGLTGVTSEATPVTVVVVGTFQPRLDGQWGTDPLHGQGHSADWPIGSTRLQAYGPVVVGDDAFRASGSYVTGLRVTASPMLSLADRPGLDDAVGGLGRASTLLTAGVGDRVRITRVGSDLPSTLARIDAQQDTTRSTVLVVVLLGAALAVVAAILAGWLVASRRDDERVLLVALGQSRRQQVTAALAEAGLLSAVAAGVAVPAATLIHAALTTHLPGMRAAGLAQHPVVTLPLVAGVLVTSILLACTLVLTALDTGTATDRLGRRRVVRGGFDVLVAVVAIVCWWQVRSQPATNADTVLTAAPVLCLAAVTVLATRLVPVALGAAARAATRSRGLVVPLAAQQAARRPHSGTAMVAIAAAVAAGTFGIGLRATWEQSQDDQAALLLGTDLSIVPAATAGHRATTAVESAVRRGALDGIVSPVVDRPLTLGTFVGQGDDPPVLVGVDATHAEQLLGGRLGDGRTWGQIGDQIAPSEPVHGVPLRPDGAGVRVEATAPARADLQVTVTAVLQDAAGLRSSVGALPVPMDGRLHRVTWTGPVARGQELVGVRLGLDGPGVPRTAPVAVSVRVPGRVSGTRPAAWAVLPARPEDSGLLSGADVAVRSAGASTVVRTTARANLAYFGYSTNELLVTAIPAPPRVPVAVSQDLADAVDAPVGARLTASIDTRRIPLEVVAIVPDVPSAPGRLAVLADVDLLSRALVDAGDLDPGIDAWWVADPSPRTVREAARLGVGEVTTRAGLADGLASGPLRIALPTALLTLVTAAVLMLLLSAGLLLASDRQRRTTEVSRLRALGLSSQGARRVLVTENALFLLPVVLVGALVGRATSWALSPELIRSDLGGAPVPPAVEVWPWQAELLLTVGAFIGVLAIATVLTVAHVRRADPARLSSGDTA